MKKDVVLPKASAKIVMPKGELIAPNQAMCDCIVFQDNQKIVLLIELKNSSLEPSKIVKQFTNAGKKSLSMITPLKHRNRFELFFILLAKNYSNYSAAQKLKQERIKIHQKKYMIHLCKCGQSLKNMMTS